MIVSHVTSSTMCAGVAITFIPMPYSPLQASFCACHDAYAMQWHCTIDFSSFWNPLAPSRRDIGNDFWQYGKHRLKIAFSRNLCLNMTRPARRGFMCLQVCDPCSCPAWLLTRGAVRWPCPSWQCLLYATSRIMSTTSRDARNINNIQARFSKIHCKKAKIYPIPYSRVRVCAYMRMCGVRWTRAHVVCFYCKMRYNWCVSTTNVVVNSKTQSILCKMASRAPRAIAAYGFKYQMIFYSSPDTGKKSRKITVMRLLA